MLDDLDSNGTWKKARLPKIIKEAMTESSIQELLHAQELKYTGNLGVLDGSNYELRVMADCKEQTFTGDSLDMSMNPISEAMVEWADRIMQK